MSLARSQRYDLLAAIFDYPRQGNYGELLTRCIDEALVRKVPVVATRVAGVPAEFTDGEVLMVAPSSPDEMADGIEAILFDPDVRRRYVEGAERRCLHWSGFASAAEQHAKLLDGTIAP